MNFVIVPGDAIYRKWGAHFFADEPMAKPGFHLL
jgi:hypothetical protein